MHKGTFLLSLLGLLLLSASTQAARLDWWQKARFGMFIHWGIYSVYGHNEWAMHNERIPAAEYERFAQRFNPTAFDAEEWAKLAKAAGQKYMVFTSKHHDGFCMFDTRLTTYNSMHSPAHRDFVKELARACRKEGIKFGVYYSILDWHQPLYKSDFQRYVREYLFPQVRELCTNYGPLAVFWFDGGWEHSAEEIHSAELLALIRSLQPGIIINNRANLPGDYSTPEQQIPALGVALTGKPWETCMTINSSWGYNERDFNYKSALTLQHDLADIAGKGGNFLLNVGPKPTGEIPLPQQVRLLQLGRWLKRNGKSIYGTAATPFVPLPEGVSACTRQGNKLYLHLFEWPRSGEIALPRLITPIKRAWLLESHEPVEVSREKSRQVLHLPLVAPDLMDTVVVVELAGLLQVDSALRPDATGAFHLTAGLAKVVGDKLRYQPQYGDLGYWIAPEDYPEWELFVPEAATYSIVVAAGCEKGQGGSSFAVEITGDKLNRKLTGKVSETESWYDYKPLRLGRVHLPAGRYKLKVKVLHLANFAVMNLKEVLLKPVEAQEKSQHIP